MRLTESLLAWLPRFFNRDPLPFIALRVRHNGEAAFPDTGDSDLVTADASTTGDGGLIAFSVTWRVADRVLTVTRLERGVPTGAFTYDLAAHTIASLADAMGDHGFIVSVGASPAQGTLSALILMDGEGDSAASNGDALFAWTSLLFAYLQPMAAELDAAEGQIGNMLLQMETQTAEKEWLDFIGSYYAVPRIMAACRNLLLFSNTLNQTPTPWAVSAATITKSAAGTWLLRGTATSAKHSITQSLALDTPFTYTATWRVRAAGATKFRAKIGDAGDTNAAYANFDTEAGAATAVDAGSGITYDASMTAMDGGWWLCRITGLPAATGTTVSLVIYLTDAAYAETFTADPNLGIELEKFQLEQGNLPSAYVASGTLTPEQDRTYGRRIITEVFRPRGNNVAIAANVEESTGQATSITDVTTYGPIEPNYNATYTHNSAILHNSAARPIYGLFDAETTYDLLGAEPPTLYIARLRETVDRLRDAGTHLRAITLGNGTIEDTGPKPLSDDITGLAMSPAMDDTAPAPAELEGEALAAAALSALADPAPPGNDEAGMTLTINYNVFYDSLRTHNAAISHQGGASPGEVL